MYQVGKIFIFRYFYLSLVRRHGTCKLPLPTLSQGCYFYHLQCLKCMYLPTDALQSPRRPMLTTTSADHEVPSSVSPSLSRLSDCPSHETIFCCAYDRAPTSLKRLRETDNISLSLTAPGPGSRRACSPTKLSQRETQRRPHRAAFGIRTKTQIQALVGRPWCGHH